MSSPHRTRLYRVLQLLSDGLWHSTAEICSPAVGGTEGLRRLRELRRYGHPITKRKAARGTQYEYRLRRQ